MLQVEILITLALISVAIAGFAAVALSPGLDAQLLPGEVRLRLTNLLIVCFVNMLFSLLPTIIVANGSTDDEALRTSQPLFAVGLAAILATRFVPSLRAAGTGASLGFFAVLMAIFMAAILLQVISAAGAPFLSVSGSYLAGLTCIVVVASTSFVRLVLAPRTPSTEGGTEGRVAEAGLDADTE